MNGTDKFGHKEIIHTNELVQRIPAGGAGVSAE